MIPFVMLGIDVKKIRGLRHLYVNKLDGRTLFSYSLLYEGFPKRESGMAFGTILSDLIELSQMFGLRNFVFNKNGTSFYSQIFKGENLLLITLLENPSMDLIHLVEEIFNSKEFREFDKDIRNARDVKEIEKIQEKIEQFMKKKLKIEEVEKEVSAENNKIEEIVKNYRALENKSDAIIRRYSLGEISRQRYLKEMKKIENEIRKLKKEYEKITGTQEFGRRIPRIILNVTGVVGREKREEEYIAMEKIERGVEEKIRERLGIKETEIEAMPKRDKAGEILSEIKKYEGKAPEPQIKVERKKGYEIDILKKKLQDMIKSHVKRI